ncbi:hypothetical protein BGZ68_008838, partial [Mortierella alpina]
MNPNLSDLNDNGEGCSTRPAPIVDISTEKGQDVAEANAQNIARAFNNFEDVYGEESEYHCNGPDDSDIDMEGSVDGDEEDDIASENASGPSTTTARRGTRKRKLAATVSDNQHASPRAK